MPEKRKTAAGNSFDAEIDAKITDCQQLSCF